MKVLGAFPYNALVIPKGSRKPRPVVLYAPTEYDIAEAPKSALVADAVVVKCMTLARHAAGGRIALDGWGGRLWKAPYYTGMIDELVRSLRFPDDAVHRFATPVSDAYDPTFGPAVERGFAAAGPRGAREEDFIGEIVRTDKAEQAARCAAAAREIAIFGDEIRFRAREPALLVRRFSDGWTLDADPAGLEHASFNDHLFRPDRLETAAEWMRRQAKHEGCEIRATVEAAMPEFLTRDDLSNYVSMRLRPLVLTSQLNEIMPYLDAGAVASWQKLARIAHRTTRSYDVPLPDGLDPATVAADVVAFYAAAGRSHLPTAMREILERLVRTDLDRLGERVAFEARRQPAAAMAQADEDALAELAAPGRPDRLTPPGAGRTPA